MTRSEIIAEIRRIADANGGQAPGRAAFAKATGIPESAWSGKLWARWSEAIVEAGLTPNQLNYAIPGDEICIHFLNAARSLGREPTMTELRMYSLRTPGAPSRNVWTRQFGGKSSLVNAAIEYGERSQDYADVLEFLTPHKLEVRTATEQSGLQDGWVYLLKSGQFYKIGRSDNVERRIKEISVALPEELSLEHAIKTDDPTGIEAYWHARFAEKRAKGEWFRLDSSDIKAFRRRKFM